MRGGSGQRQSVSPAQARINDPERRMNAAVRRASGAVVHRAADATGSSRMPLRRLSAVVVLSAVLAIVLAELVHMNPRPLDSVATLCDSGGKRRCP